MAESSYNSYEVRFWLVPTPFIVTLFTSSAEERVLYLLAVLDIRKLEIRMSVCLSVCLSVRLSLEWLHTGYPSQRTPKECPPFRTFPNMIASACPILPTTQAASNKKHSHPLPKEYSQCGDSATSR